MDSGHPEMWKMHSTLETAAKDLDQGQRDIQRIVSEIDHLQDNVGEALAEASQRTQVVDDLLESQRRFEVDLVWVAAVFYRLMTRFHGIFGQYAGLKLCQMLTPLDCREAVTRKEANCLHR